MLEVEQTAGARRDEFDRLIAPLLKPLYNSALGFVRDPSEAEDAVMDTVVRAYRSFDQFERGTNFKAWVFRILTNHCINRFRRREREPDAVAYDDVEREAEMLASQQQSPSVLPDEALLGRMLDEEVLEAVKGLPEEFRAVVVLSDLQEYTYREIADILAIPIGTVRSRLFRGRRLLQKALAGYAVERGLIQEADLG
ncbi:MAG: sigma-70 family RNA polymerase sigma factor [Armatimonadetes bacterium]|nr:sigma-70 family RNA polymerase sigma factor [Armatimonadota bacterium]